MTKVTLFKQDGTTNGEIELNSDEAAHSWQ